MCFPRWHSDGLFSELIGGGGTYAVRPRGRCIWGGYYERGSLIWRSRWVTDEGIVECREALALPSQPGRAVVLRSIAVVAGRGSLSARLALAAGFGDEPMDEAPPGRRCVAASGRAKRPRSGRARRPRVPGDGAALELELDLAEGDRHDLVLVLEGARDPAAPVPARAWSETEAAWAEGVPGLEHVGGDPRSAARGAPSCTG